MGWIRNECIVISDCSEQEVLTAHIIATEIYNQKGCGSLVSPIQRHLTNGGAAFWIIPDGSKEGWHHSNIADEAREEFLNQHLRKSSLNWAHIILGGDDGRYEVISSPNTEMKK